jgi:hypothetical protein
MNEVEFKQENNYQETVKCCASCWYSTWDGCGDCEKVCDKMTPRVWIELYGVCDEWSDSP